MGISVTEAEWEGLRATAETASLSAWAPYSNFRVGVALLLDDGKIVAGCNVENASYGLTMCGENVAIGAAVLSTRETPPVVIAAYTMARDSRNEPMPAMPCGKCRQLLYEFGGPECLVNGDGTRRPLSELLPGAFGPADVGVRPPWT